ncbi:hypothetical protein XELAEV_18045438mg [Xenopus laevis]|uniref:Uncharacterized protein n=1 Tax=Xenopus laevis TaxID=8355 RepID=A0A974C1H8_XENLA|nr:hypothetical protein XELAEV_18045438mg [Xenopus laevis]
MCKFGFGFSSEFAQIYYGGFCGTSTCLPKPIPRKYSHWGQGHFFKVQRSTVILLCEAQSAHFLLSAPCS